MESLQQWLSAQLMPAVLNLLLQGVCCLLLPHGRPAPTCPIQKLTCTARFLSALLLVALSGVKTAKAAATAAGCVASEPSEMMCRAALCCGVLHRAVM